MEEEMRKIEEEFAFQEKWIKIFKRGKFFFQNIPENLILKIITKMEAKAFFNILRAGKWMLLLCEENRRNLLIPYRDAGYSNMPGLDWIPGISQLKSTVQLITGDVDGAAQTQLNFLQECPIISQGTSLGQLLAGDAEGALETQKKCLGTVNNVANGIPVVGHVKGIVHYAVGDEKGGNQAMNAASRTTVVIASGAVAGITTGGIAAIPAGIAAGAAYDVTGTLITDERQGLVAAIGNAVDNPNAGNIFEAAFVPVGDGLGGYAGGKLGNAVVNQVKLGNLQAARAAKMGQLDAAMFGETELTSAQATSLGQQINALTSQINIIEQGTPQYWFDAKSNRVVVTKTPPTNTAVTVVGYFDEKDPEKAEQQVREAYSLQCDAIYSDLYNGVEFAGNCTTQAQKQTQLQTYKTQQQKGKIGKAYTNVPIFTENKIDDLKRERNNNPNQKTSSHKLFEANSLLSVPMPSQFTYTGAIMRNENRQGLLHSLLRHSVEWAQVIPGFHAQLGRLSDATRRALRDIGSATPSNAEALLNAYIMDSADIEALSDLQMQIYRYLCGNISYRRYLGEGINQYGRLQVFFEVTDINGTQQVMVICPSTQLYLPDSLLKDGRPVRTITTILFISWKDYQRRKIGKTF